jgi:hypothetical protein
LARQLGTGIFFDKMNELSTQLRDREQLQIIRDRVWQQRDLFTFDYHVPKLVDFFRGVIGSASSKTERGRRLA